MSDRPSPDELAQFHQWRNEETARRLMRETVEKVICEVWDIRWESDGGHWDELKAMREDMKVLRGRLKARAGFVTAAGISLRDKMLAGLYATALGLGGAWLLGKLGLKLPGGLP